MQSVFHSPGALHPLSVAQRQNFIAEHTFDLFAETDGEGRYLYASANHLEVLGYAPEALTGTFYRDKIHPDDWNWMQLCWTQMLEQNQARVEFRFRHQNGDWRWLEDIAKALGALSAAKTPRIFWRFAATSLTANATKLNCKP